MIEFRLLDEIFQKLGYYSIFSEETETIEECKEEGGLYYTSMKTGEIEIEVHFLIVINNGKDEDIRSFYLSIEELKIK